MAWYEEAAFYHIYPLGLTGAPQINDYNKVEHRLNTLIPWIGHIKKLGCTALYIGPLFESKEHGYDTTDYKKLDSRLGDNKDLSDFVKECHKQGVKVIFDGVFNHTGRDFFAFKDIQQNRENSRYRDWYCNVNFGNNNEYNDGFSYDNWGGYNLLVKFNQKNPEVKEYIGDVIRYWVKEFDIDGIRLDAADVLDFDFMKHLRYVANTVKEDFWLMGEVIHGDYINWVNESTLHAVTNYHLYKALYSGHNDHNYFEVAHTVKRLYGMGGNKTEGLRLYNFVDNHDVERIYTILQDKKQYFPVNVLMYTLPGVPSIYYGSEFGIEGRKERSSDASLRPALNLDNYKDAIKNNPCTKVIAALGKVRQEVMALSYGDYRELMLTNRQYAFSRNYNGQTAVVAVNNDDNAAFVNITGVENREYTGAFSGKKINVTNGTLSVELAGNAGEIWVAGVSEKAAKELKSVKINIKDVKKAEIKMEAQQEEQQKEQAQQEEISKKSQTATAKSDDNKTKGKSETKKANTDKTKTKQANTDKTKAVKHDTKKKDKEINIEEVLSSKSFEEMTVEELQLGVLYKMSKNGPITEQMKKDVTDNVYHDSLVNWIKSFR